MVTKWIPLVLLPLLAFSQPAEARRLFWWQMMNPDGTAISPDIYSDTYAPQDYYGDNPDYYPPDALSPDEQFNQLQYDQYRREMARRNHRRVYYQDPAQTDYGQPDFGVPPPYSAPVYPVRHAIKHAKKLVQQKPPVQKASKPPVMPTGPITAATAAPPVTDTATVSTPTKPASRGGVSCAKGATIVSSFGFSNVTTKSCAGGTLVYGAERSGKNFEVNVSAASGELTAVKKL
jgi:hypothetical protein